ncbi:MAG: DUF4082 domain-containing protein [Microcystis sp.]|jgi:hypothetical protein|uniref:DUF4082 domain-containing protein n=1 Tax=Microcystis sp. TaxID=1127 RepID=UPI0022C13A11|nr:DUF4082 domain-containing protein [Microcystis sp. LE17-20D]MCZ8068664.1 DUF4082 domain-containing protein [Microcystis sp. LE17-20D]MCZ8162268.1 DUF4082 domain-containing protein [Microcystis sp. LE19-196.1B]MCZ8274762.1 DUF4082 domain-containing protein [Microcystis sp. LE19-4.1E]
MLKNLASVSTLVIPFLFFPTQAQASVALQSFTGGSLFTDVNGTNMTVGWSFAANDNLSVTSLGLWDETPADPLAQTHQVGLWSSTGTLLGSATIQTNSPLTGSFRYAAIAPVALTSGLTYFLGSEISNPFSDQYTSSASSIVTAPEITFLGGARNNSAGGFSFPSITTSVNGRFGPNFQFQVVSASVPEPTSTLGLLALGTLGAASTLKRKLKP